MSQTFRKLTFRLVILASLVLHFLSAKSHAQKADANHSVDLQTTRERIDLPTAIKQLLSENLDLQIERIEPKAADALAIMFAYGGGNAAIGAWAGRV